jgi:hypothetical protein
MPPGGLTQALTEEMFIVPPNYTWDIDNSAEFAAAAAAVLGITAPVAQDEPDAPVAQAAAPAPLAPTTQAAESAPIATVAQAAEVAEVVDDAEPATAITSRVATALNAYEEAISAYEEAISAYVEAQKEGKPFYEEARTAYWASHEVRKLWETYEEVRKEGKMFEIRFIHGQPIEPIDLFLDSLIDPTDDLEETPTTPQSTTAAPPVGDLDAFLNSLTD